MNKDYTYLKRISSDDYKIKRNPDNSLDILLSTELSKLLSINTNTEFKIQIEHRYNKDVIILKSNRIKKDHFMYN